MALIELHGRGTVFRIVTLTKKLVKELTVDGVDEFRLDEIFFERGDTEVALAGFDTDFEIAVDGEVMSREAVGSLMVNREKPTKLKKKKLYLVREEVQKGCWSRIKTRKRFDPSKLVISADDLNLPDGTKYSLLDLEYDGESEFGGTVGQLLEEYVVLEDGTRINVKRSGS